MVGKRNLVNEETEKTEEVELHTAEVHLKGGTVITLKYDENVKDSVEWIRSEESGQLEMVEIEEHGTDKLYCFLLHTVEYVVME